MTTEPLPVSPLRLRLATLAFPPFGLLLLWRGPHGFGRKLFGTLGVVLYGVPYTALVLFLLHRFTGLQVEMQGRPIPVPTYAVSDFDKLERDRARHARPAGVVPVVSTNRAPYWTGFRGPNRDGHYAEQTLPFPWPTGGPRLMWKQPVGGGYSSFAIAGGLAFTVEQRRQQEAVTAYEVETGREVWAHTYDARFHEWMGGEGPRATPAWHDGRVYALGGAGEFRCLDAATGALLWRHDVLKENSSSNLFFGHAASPLVVDDQVIALAGEGVAPGAPSVIAYDRVTGAVRWRALEDKASYTAPMVVTLAGERQLLVVTASRVLGLPLGGGKPLWFFPWRVEYDNAIAQPILFGADRFLLSAGYGTGSVAVEVGRNNSGFVTKELWRNKQLKNKFTSSVLWQGHAYGLDEDILVCLDVATGERKWKDGRYGYGQVLLASGHLVILCGDGDLALVKATPERHEELSRVPAIKGKTWNHPAISHGRLLVRNAIEMACFDLLAH